MRIPNKYYNNIIFENKLPEHIKKNSEFTKTLGIYEKIKKKCIRFKSLYMRRNSHIKHHHSQ